MKNNIILYCVLLSTVCMATEPLIENSDKTEIKVKLTHRYLNAKITPRKGRLELALKLDQHHLGHYSVPLDKTPYDYAYIDFGLFVKANADVIIHGLKHDLTGITIDDAPKGNAPTRMTSQAGVQAFTAHGIKMIHTPSEGKMWDPSILWHDGWYYLYAMHNADMGEWRRNGMWGAKSRDGVHWQDLGPVIADSPLHLKKMFVMHNGEHFIAAHGSRSNKPGHGNDTICHWKSVDGVTWEYLGKETDTHPDPRWYRASGRWDCMYVVPKENGKGWMGYTVANNKSAHGCIGLLASEDSIHWTVLPPVPIDWQGVAAGFAEYVGIEKIKDRYYSICGNRLGQYGCPLYSTYTFVSDSPDGPFTPDKKAFRLCGGTGAMDPPQWLATFGRGKDNEILITNYVGSWGWGPDVTLLPIKKALVDNEGHLRPGYWKSNEAAKGIEKRIAPRYSVNGVSQRKILLLDQGFDFQKGVILEGVISAKASSPHTQDCYAGFYLDHKQDGQGAGVLIGIGGPETRRSYIGLLRTFEESTLFDPVDDVAGPDALRNAGLGVANVTGIANDKPHTFRLWIRQGLLELYIDDIAMQTFFTGEVSGTIGFLAENAQVSFSKVRCWEMNIRLSCR